MSRTTWRTHREGPEPVPADANGASIALSTHPNRRGCESWYTSRKGLHCSPGKDRMAFQTALTHRFGLAHPIIQAPLGGGGTTVEMVVATCEAGALGVIAGAYLSPAEIAAAAREVRSRTSRPFGVNVFAPTDGLRGPIDVEAALAALRPIHDELGLSAPSLPEQLTYAFDDQFGAVLESDASVFSFTFGIPPAEALEAARARGMALMGMATTVSEGVALEAAGVDIVVAQGSEAGGHRGTFGGRFDAAMVGTIALVPQMVDAVRIPVVASGGIMDGRGIAASLCLGASAVQMGTAFLVCHESGIPEAYKEAILGARDDATRLTTAFSGRPARGIVNRLMSELESAPEETILPYPAQNALTRPLRSAAARQGRTEFLSLWAGQGLTLARRQGVAELITALARETESAWNGAGSAR